MTHLLPSTSCAGMPSDKPLCSPSIPTRLLTATHSMNQGAKERPPPATNRKRHRSSAVISVDLLEQYERGPISRDDEASITAVDRRELERALILSGLPSYVVSAFQNHWPSFDVVESILMYAKQCSHLYESMSSIAAAAKSERDELAQQKRNYTANERNRRIAQSIATARTKRLISELELRTAEVKNYQREIADLEVRLQEEIDSAEQLRRQHNKIACRDRSHQSSEGEGEEDNMEEQLFELERELLMENEELRQDAVKVQAELDQQKQIFSIYKTQMEIKVADLEKKLQDESQISVLEVSQNCELTVAQQEELKAKILAQENELTLSAVKLSEKECRIKELTEQVLQKDKLEEEVKRLKAEIAQVLPEQRNKIVADLINNLTAKRNQLATELAAASRWVQERKGLQRKLDETNLQNKTRIEELEKKLADQISQRSYQQPPQGPFLVENTLAASSCHQDNCSSCNYLKKENELLEKKNREIIGVVVRLKNDHHQLGARLNEADGKISSLKKELDKAKHRNGSVSSAKKDAHYLNCLIQVIGEYKDKKKSKGSGGQRQSIGRVEWNESTVKNWLPS